MLDAKESYWGTSLLRKANRLLADSHRTPRLANKKHPVSELIFIILSARTRGVHHEAVYRALRRKFKTWEAVRDASVRSIQAVIRDAGLSATKARQIKSLLQQLTIDFGSLTGNYFRAMPDEELEAYLASLPGVGVKTARCVMMYSLNRQVFPVDTHCIRLFRHLGLVEGAQRFEEAQVPMQAMVPREIRYSLHVNAVAHGRRICVPRSERCNECAIASLCITQALVGTYPDARTLPSSPRRRS